MDFRPVEAKFRRAALLLQVVLCVLLFGYVVVCVKEIASSSSDPPVETTTFQWKKDLGAWAVCGGSRYHSKMSGVGTGVAESAMEIHTYNESNAALAGAKLSPPQLMALDGWKNCSIVDLSDADVKVPLYLRLCADTGPEAYFYLKVEGQWIYITHFGAPGALKWYSLSRMVHGWNLGYSTIQNNSFWTHTVDGPWTHNINRTYLCASGMSHFGPARGHASVLQLSIVNAFVVAHHKQGIIPQLINLFSSTGGYITFLSIVFTSFFVKKYPDSAVIKTYDARTFVFEKFLSSAPEEKETE